MQNVRQTALARQKWRRRRGGEEGCLSRTKTNNKARTPDERWKKEGSQENLRHQLESHWLCLWRHCSCRLGWPCCQGCQSCCCCCRQGRLHRCPDQHLARCPPGLRCAGPVTPGPWGHTLHQHPCWTWRATPPMRK